MKLLVATTAALSLSLFPTVIKATETKSIVAQQNSMPTDLEVVSKDTTSEIAALLPADTSLVGLFDTKAETWASLNRFQLFQMAQDAIEKFVPLDLKLDYEKYVQSLVGEQVAIACMSKMGTAVYDLNSNCLMMVSIKDEAQLQSLLDAQQVTKREYKGITILEFKDVKPPAPLRNLSKLSPKSKVAKPEAKKTEQGLAIATLPGYAVASVSAKPIERLIDVKVENTANLSQNPQFQQTIQDSQKGKVLFTLYENLSTFLPIIQDLSKDPKQPVPLFSPDLLNLDQINQYTTINAFLKEQPEGLGIQVNAYLDKTKTKSNKSSKTLSDPERILTRMPGVTYSAITSRNLNQQWQMVATALDTKPELKDYLKSFREFVRTTTGLDFDKDIMDWMDGEYAFFSFPTKGGIFQLIGPNFNFGVGVAMQTSKRTAAETTTKKLEDFIQSVTVGAVKVNTTTIKGQSITSWDFVRSPSQSLIAYSWVDEDTLVLATGFGAIKDLVPQPNVLLPSTYNFQTAINPLPRPNQGYFYMNMGSTLSWIYGFIPSNFTSDQNVKMFKQAMGSIYSISGTSSKTVDKEQFDMLFVLAPTRTRN
jgi:hypothetical protein